MKMTKQVNACIKFSLLAFCAAATFACLIAFLRNVMLRHIRGLRKAGEHRIALECETPSGAAGARPGGTQGENAVSVFSFGNRDALKNGRKNWIWPASGELKKTAFERFLAAGRWDAALSAAARLHPAREDLLAAGLPIAGKSYLAHISRALESEEAALRKEGFDPEALPPPERLAFYANVSFRLRGSIRSAKIAEIMTTAFLESRPDRLVRELALRGKLAFSTGARIDFRTESAAFFLKAFANDPEAPGRCMKMIWDDFTKNLGRNPELAEALDGVPATGGQRSLIHAFSASEKFALTPAEFELLPPEYKAAFSVFALGRKDTLANPPVAAGFRKTLHGSDFLELLNRAAVSPEFPRIIRRSKGWLDAVERFDYDRAAAYASDFHEKCFESKLGIGMFDRLLTPLRIESRLFGRFVSKEQWKNALDAFEKRNPGTPLTTAGHPGILRRLTGFDKPPGTDGGDAGETAAKRALLAAFLLNRGERGSKLPVLLHTSKQNIIKTGIPPEELENE